MRKFPVKRFTALILSAALTLGMIAGCGNENSKETNQTADAAKGSASDISGEVTFVSSNDTTGALDDMIAEFNKKYPNVKVDHQELPGNSDDVKKSLLTSFAAGDSDPDVFECDIIWVSQFAAAGWLLDVTNELESKADEYVSGPLSTCYYNDKAYAFPNYTDVGLLYYRKDLIDNPPKTWDELVEQSKKHIGKDGIDYGYVFQMFQGEPTSCNMLEFIKQNGGNDIVNGKSSFNNSNTIESLKFVNSLIDQGISPEGVLSHKPDDSLAIFSEGKSLFMRNWTYAYAAANSDTSKVAGKVGVTSLPTGPNGTESSGTLGGWNFGINANTDNKEASVAFAEFMSGYDAQKIETLKRSTFPTNAKVYEDKEVTTQLPFLSDVREAAENAKPRPQVRDYATISNLLQIYFHKALTGESKYEDALKELDTEIDKALAEMK